MQEQAWCTEEEELIIWNSALGIRDFVTIGEIEESADKRDAWLEVPYEMVGPFCLDELAQYGRISFAACIVMTRKRWQTDQVQLRQESFARRQRAEQELYEELKAFNRQKQMYQATLDTQSEKAHRKLLELPLEGLLEVVEIKTAYRQVAKRAHPDTGGSSEHFFQIKEARDALIERFS